jgi:hypothetical protein
VLFERKPHVSKESIINMRCMHGVRVAGTLTMMGGNAPCIPSLPHSATSCCVSDATVVSALRASSRRPHVVIISNGSSREASGKLTVDRIGASLDFLFLSTFNSYPVARFMTSSVISDRSNINATKDVKKEDIIIA